MSARKIICATLLAVFLFIGSRVSPSLREREPDRFSLDKIALHIFEDGLPTFSLPDLSKTLHQPFHYLGHGVETIAFLSEDGQFVLKFFLQESMQGKRRFSLPRLNRKAKQQRRKELSRQSLLKTMKNYAAAFQRMPTGSIALHLTPTSHLLPTVVVFDQQGQEHRIELDSASFVLQHKAVLVKDKLAGAGAEEQLKILQALEDFFVLRAEQGFSDIKKTCTIETNFGFVGDCAVQFDVGKVAFSETLQASPEAEIQRMKEFLCYWTQNLK